MIPRPLVLLSDFLNIPYFARSQVERFQGIVLLRQSPLQHTNVPSNATNRGQRFNHRALAKTSMERDSGLRCGGPVKTEHCKKPLSS